MQRLYHETTVVALTRFTKYYLSMLSGKYVNRIPCDRVGKVQPETQL